MDLLVKIIVLAFVAATIVAIAIWFTYPKLTSSNITENAAIAIVISDLKQQIPNANITIINVSKSIEHQGSWDMSILITENASRICPYVKMIKIDYPALGLANITTAVYSAFNGNSCSVNAEYSRSEMQDSLITLPEIAIAIPYNQSYAPLLNFIQKYGYNSITAKAVFMPAFNMSNSTCYSCWLLEYSTKATNATLSLLINKYGTIVGNIGND
ncbi:MAG: hypothetical protein QXS03_00715 [Candidatus Micrarchaeaceae archaeon]